MPFKKPHQTADPGQLFPKDDNTKFVIKPRGLNIIWGNDRRYWKPITDDAAELIQVSWLEVSGKVPKENIQVGATYNVKFDIEVKDTGFGWGNTEVLVMAKIGKKGQYKYSPVKLACSDGRGYIPKQNGDQLKITAEGADDLDLHFGLYEVWSGKWKGGLIIYQAEITKQS